MDTKGSVERRSYTVAEIASRNHLGVATIWREISAQKLLARKLGRRTIITAEDERAWLEAMPRAHAKPVAA